MSVKDCALLLLSGAIITLSSCKKQEVQEAVSQNTEDFVNPTYLAVGTIINPSSTNNIVAAEPNPSKQKLS
jgi:thiamine monophosphate synthase